MAKVEDCPGFETFWLCQDRHTIFLEIFSAASKVGALIVLAFVKGHDQFRHEYGSDGDAAADLE